MHDFDVGKFSWIHETYLMDQQLFCWRHFSKIEVVQNTDFRTLVEIYRNLMISYFQFTKCAWFLIEFFFLHFFFSGLTSIFGVFHSSKFIDLFLCFPILLISLTRFGSFWFFLGLKLKISQNVIFVKKRQRLTPARKKISETNSGVLVSMVFNSNEDS